MGFEVHPIVARGVFATYGYFLVDARSASCLLVDPGAQAQLFANALQEKGWTLRKILLTHGHFDHIGAVDELSERFGVPAFAHRESARYLGDAALNLSASHGLSVAAHVECTLSDGDEIVLEDASDCTLQVLHVTGHTMDSVAYYDAVGGYALVGDTVYEGGPGLTVFPTGDAAQLEASIQGKLLALPHDTVLLSGHSHPITVAQLSASLNARSRLIR